MGTNGMCFYLWIHILHYGGMVPPGVDCLSLDSPLEDLEYSDLVGVQSCWLGIFVNGAPIEIELSVFGWN
jgi:hypothetical protein